MVSNMHVLFNYKRKWHFGKLKPPEDVFLKE